MKTTARQELDLAYNNNAIGTYPILMIIIIIIIMFGHMKVTVVPIVISMHKTIPKGLVKRLEESEIKGQVETIKSTVLLTSVTILRQVLKT